MRRSLMKIVVACIAIGLAFGSAINATLPLGIGVKAGLAYANQEFRYADSKLNSDRDWRTGLVVGLFAEKGLVSNIACRLEALYVQKGFKDDFIFFLETPPSMDTLESAYRADYLSLNLLVKGSLPIGIYALAGPRLDIAIGSKQDDPAMIPKSWEDKYKGTIFGISFGVGREFKLAGFGVIFIEGQYYFDLGKVYSYDIKGTEKVGTLTSIKNKAFGFYVGIRF